MIMSMKNAQEYYLEPGEYVSKSVVGLQSAREHL